MTSAMAFLMALVGAVQVHVAPDQPVAHVYVGDPLILEMVADTDASIDAEVKIVPDVGAEPTSIAIPTSELRAGSARWLVLEQAPTECGRYAIRGKIAAPGAAAEDVEAVFCRINRPDYHCRT